LLAIKLAHFNRLSLIAKAKKRLYERKTTTRLTNTNWRLAFQQSGYFAGDLLRVVADKIRAILRD
ncbi:MAG: hypothetical protein LBC09_01905, partial [Helicobacteraceae bacterium]|jgi:hypothetical protein|nr:hypothetical protein [Helicobacteraceae bacterium]